MNKLLVCLIVATGAFFSPAFSQSQGEMNREALADFNKADAELNVVYKKIVSKLSAEDKSQLVEAQRAWIKYRDAEAAFEADCAARGGTMRPLIYYSACTSLTKGRIKDLNDVFLDR